VPETKGKSLMEIQVILGGDKEPTGEKDEEKN
jgi:hypothetical protein